MPQPFTAIIPADALDVSGLPPHARQPGTPEFKKAVSEMLAGDLQAFGLDGTIKVIKLAAIVHKGFHQDPTILNAVDVVKMATCEGARVVGREDEIGSLEVGKLADFFLFDPRNVACVPVTDPITCLVYSSNPASVQTVVIHGRIVMQDGVIRSMDEAEAVHALQESAYGLRQRVGLGNTINGRPVDVGPFTRRD